jgi:hypothetical protein
MLSRNVAIVVFNQKIAFLFFEIPIEVDFAKEGVEAARRIVIAGLVLYPYPSLQPTIWQPLSVLAYLWTRHDWSRPRH